MKSLALGAYCAAALSLFGCATHQAAPAADNSFTQAQIDTAVHDALKSGYRAKLLHGDTLYCHEQTHLGTHFASTDCYTPDQLAKLELLQASLHDMLNQPMVCDGGTCNGRGAVGGGGR